MSDSPRPLDGLSLLDQIRPPPGYRTTWAIGTTYSLDLVACVAAVVALDGRARDTTGFTIPSALRALGNLRDRVRIFAQQGCIHPSPRSNPRVLALLDRIVRPVPFNLERQSFHPKVWIVRQDPMPTLQDEGPRFVLIVGSRNLTRDSSWDLGIALEGVLATRTNIDGVRAFAEHVCGLGGETGFGAEHARALDRVEWGELPRGVKTLRFAWHGGDRKALSTEDGHPLGLPVGQKLLVLTPFLDAYPVVQLASKWRHVDQDCKLLLAGLDSLLQVSRNDKDGKALASLRPCSVGVSRDEPPEAQDEEPAQPSPGDSEAELLEPDRGLHAKVIAVWTGRKTATVLFGSANLTKRAWNAFSCEAWVIAEGGADLADSLWAWAARRATRFDPLAAPPPPPDDEEAQAFEKAHRAVSARAFSLEEPGSAPAFLRSEPPLPLAHLHGLSLAVARLSTPDRSVLWTGREATEMPACQEAERTRFLRLELRGKARAKAWIQAVEVAPPIQPERDVMALRDLLGPEQFLNYLWTCLDERRGDGEEEDEDDEGGGSAGGGGGTAARPLRLEALLHAISRARRAGQAEALRDLDRMLRDYRGGLTTAPAQRLAELFDAWDAIREAMLS
ncbi:hypothetical protein BE04_37750 [Sorangium cellulosum]|uniref:PLD phosphodiesterase domain-containing protein n=1 Tax=Sorangium cellulosum TaxID=56 RepID=A0A150P0Z0_SORCE|nr:hypothetical protein BE04_37750 [Sorangium cellulosum]